MLSDVSGAPTAATEDWRTLVDHAGGPLVVRGPAGSGKTELLLERFLWLVEQGLMPDRIAWIAPTAARVEAARVRLEQALRDGYSELVVATPAQLAALILRRAGSYPELPDAILGQGDRLAMLAERIDQLPLRHHDFAGNAGALLGRFIRRIDRLEAELVDADAFAAWAAGRDDPAEREFAEVFRAHEQMLRDAGACDERDLVRLALRLLGERPAARQPFEHVLVDDAQELDLAPARLVAAVGGRHLTVAGDPLAGLRRFRGAAAARLDGFEGAAGQAVQLLGSHRCSPAVMQAAWALGLGDAASSESELQAGDPAERTVAFWRCANERAQAQAVAAEIERLIAHEEVAPGRIAVVVPEISLAGQAVSVALEERAVPHRLIGEAAFFQRAEIRDLLAWLRLLADPGDAAAVVRALARPPIDLRSIDIARCTQIARRRKLDMVAALAAATESPQVPPEARERIRVFLKLYRAGAAQIDTVRPDLYVHRLIERIGLRRQQLFAAQADVVERLRALARFGELAGAYVGRAPQATPREFARSIAAVADFGLREHEDPELVSPAAVQVLGLDATGGLEVDHVFVLGLGAGLSVPPPEPIPDELLHEQLPPDDERSRAAVLRSRLYGAVSRARRRAVLSYPCAADRGPATAPAELVEAARRALAVPWEDKDEELFGPDETLQSTYRLVRDELLEGTIRAGARLGELRFDTDLDVSHAVVRYLELLKLAALLSRPDGQGVAEALGDVNARIGQAVTAEQREIFGSSLLDEYLLDAERDARRRAQVVAARDEPSLERFLPLRGDGVVLSATDIDSYRACPLRYKFARIFRIPQEPTLHQRFGILMHQVLERYHGGGDSFGAADSSPAPLAELLGLLDAGWRRGGFGDSEEERQLRGKAAAALARYHERASSEDAQPLWFERQFTFHLGPHLLRGRVDRVDRTESGEYELIDYKTGRPKTAAQLSEDVQLSLYAVGAREAWGLEASRGAYYYLLDDEKVAVPGDEERAEWIRSVAVQVADGIRAQEFEPTPSLQACSACDYRLVCPAAEH